MARFLWLLLLAFIILKIANVITWSWWLVFTPLYINIILAIVLTAVACYDIWRKTQQ